MTLSQKTLPPSPGVYIFKNGAGQVLYVGKAKNLRQRVRSYFQRPQELEPHKQLMIRQAKKLEHLVAGSEIEALLLEANLIKKCRPKYNVLLKDDKSYKYIKIDYSVDFPKIYFVRRPNRVSRLSPSKPRDPSRIQDKCFGPYTDGYAANQTLELMRKVFRWRTCDRHIPYDGSVRYDHPCLYYHIKLCLAPCIGNIGRADYEQLIQNGVRFLQGRRAAVVGQLERQMKELSRHHEYEQAALRRDQLRDLQKITSQKNIISTRAEKAADRWESQQALAIFSPHLALQKLQKLLALPSLPCRIEAYDVSNLQGTSATGSMVVFLNGLPAKAHYRRFAIRQKTTPDDVAMLGEVLTRRLQHLATGWPRPDLILIDGGASQLHLAQKVLRPLNLTIPVVSLAKKEEVIFTTKNRRPIKLATRDSIRILLQQLRDEAHRFAVSYHTHLHRHKSVHSRLDQIPGLGPRTIKKLRQKFGTLSALRQATPEAIAAVVGPARARAIFDQLF